MFDHKVIGDKMLLVKRKALEEIRDHELSEILWIGGSGFTHTAVSPSYTTVATVHDMFFEMPRGPIYLLERNF